MQKPPIFVQKYSFIGRSSSKKNNENKTTTPAIKIRSSSKASLRSSKSRDMAMDDVSDSENDSIDKDNEEEEIQLAVSPRFNWKDVDGVAKPNATIK